VLGVLFKRRLHYIAPLGALQVELPFEGRLRRLAIITAKFYRFPATAFPLNKDPSWKRFRDRKGVAVAAAVKFKNFLKIIGENLESFHTMYIWGESLGLRKLFRLGKSYRLKALPFLCNFRR
jgi:hypothetical protein